MLLLGGVHGRRHVLTGGFRVEKRRNGGFSAVWKDEGRWAPICSFLNGIAELVSGSSGFGVLRALSQNRHDFCEREREKEHERARESEEREREREVEYLR